MAEPLAVLIVEDSESDAQLLVRLLKKAGYKVAYEQVDTSEGMGEALDKRSWDIVISDYSLPQFDGPAALKLLKDKGLDIPFIVVSGTIGEEIAVAMMKSGALDYLVKGDLARLVPAVERELEQARVRRENKKKEAEIQAADKRFRALIENNADAITLLDAQGRVIYDSPSAPGLLGYSPTDWIGEDVFQLLHPEDQQKSRGMLRDILENPGVRVDSNFRLRKKDGSWLWIEATAKNLLEEPSVNAIVMNYRDITPRMEAEEALKKSESDFRRLFDNANDVIVIIQPEDEIILEANAAACAAYGFDHDELVGMSLKKLTKHVQKGEMHIQEMLAGRPQSNFDSIHLNKNGEEIQFLINCSLIEYRGKKAILSINRDITERKRAEEALRESESIFRGFLEQSEDAIMLTDEQGVVIQWSKGAEKLTGYSKDDTIGKPLWDVQFRSALDEHKSTKQFEFIKSSLQAVLLTGQGPILNHLLETAMQKPDGTRVDAQTLAFSIDTDKGHLLGSILRDVTERKQAEESIRSSEERFRSLYENNTLGLYRTTPDGRILLANPALVKMLGFASADELKARNLEQAGYEPSYARAQFLETIEAQGQVYGLESSWERRDGSPIFIRESARAVRGPDGKTLYYDGTVEDITERKRAEALLRESEQRFKVMFEQAPLAINITRGTDIMYANPAYISMFGYSSLDEIQKIPPLELFTPEWRPVIQNNIEQRAQGHTVPNGYEAECIRKDGTRFSVLMNFSRIMFSDGLATVGFIIDITESKRAEEAVHASEARYKGLFEDSPVALWEEDFSLVKVRLDALKEEGVTDFNEYFKSHPEAAVECISLIKVLDVNKKTMSLFGAKQKEDILRNLTEIFAGEPIQIFQDELVNIARGQTKFAWEGMNNTLDGRRINVELIWSAAPGFENSLSRVILSMIDVTERKKAEAALARSEQEYRTLFENMPIGLYRTSANGRILDANRAMIEMFGYKDREAMLAVNVAELYVDPASDEKFKSEIEKTGVVSNFEAEFRRPDGSTFWTEDHNHVIWSESGSPRYYEGSLIDITERKQVEAERQALTDIMQAATLTDTLQKFLERVRTSLATVLDAENFFVVFHNKVTGLFEEIFAVDRYDGPMPPSRLEKSISAYVLRTGEPLLLTRARFEELREAGEVELVGAPQASWLGAPLLTLNGAIGVIAVQNYEDPGCYSERDRDFLASVAGEVALAIERRLAEEALAEERNLLRTLIDNLPDRVYVKDAQGRKTLANLADWQASRLKTMEEVIGKNDFDIYPPALAEEYWAIDKEILDSGTPVINFEEPGLDAYGNLVWILTTKVPLRDGHGKITGLVGIGHDITQRKEVEKRIQNQLDHLAALRSIDQVITSSFDLHYNLRWILETLTKELGVDAADILMLNTGFGSLEFSAGVGFRDKAPERASVRLDHTYAGRVVLERQFIQVHDLNEQQHDLQLRSQLTGEDFVSYIGVPLMAKGSIKGVLEAFHRGRLEPDQEWIDLLNTLAGQAALAIDNGSLFESLQRSNIDLTLAYDATIEGWSRAMDLRDKETEGHTLRVTKMTMDLAVLFGIKDEDLVSIRRGSLLHDIGKMGVPDAILLKPGALTDEEWVIMRKHPALAYEMLAPISYLRSAIDIPYCHHEKWDGTGYPRGLKGEQIPLSARIFAIVDVWDALISDRPYRKAWSNEKILEYLKSGSGTHFDPQVVKLCLETGVFERK